MRERFLREVRAAGLQVRRDPSPVTEADLAPLPATAQRFFRRMAVLGRPRDWSFVGHPAGRFRASPTAAWQPMHAWQYNTGAPGIARIFHIRLRMFGVPVLARDTYVRGRGRMLARPLDLFPVVDGTGPEFDLGELVTWLNDAVLMAPSMLLVPAVSWAAVDDGSVDVTVTDGANRVTARLFVDADGLPTDFHTTDRWYAAAGAKGPPVRSRWTTPVEGWRAVDGRMLFSRGTAVWKLPGGDLPYAEFTLQPGALAFNVAPGETGGLR